MPSMLLSAGQFAQSVGVAAPMLCVAIDVAASVLAAG